MILYEVEWGSRLFGLKTTQSDRDLGVIVEGSVQVDRPNFDCTIKSSDEALISLKEGEPAIALWAFAPGACVRSQTDFTTAFRNRRRGLLTTTFIRSCQSVGQALIESRDQRLSPKEAYLIRTYQYLQKQTLNERTIALPPGSHERDELRRVRDGEVSPLRVARQFQYAQPDIEKQLSESELPEEPAENLCQIFQQ